MQKAEDVYTTLKVTIDNLVKGADLHTFVNVNRLCRCNLQENSCETCNQTGTYSEHHYIPVTVVPGMRPGQRIRRLSIGSEGVNMIRGDVVVTIELLDVCFTRGDDIYVKEPVYRNFVQLQSNSFEIVLPAGISDVPVRLVQTESLTDGVKVVRGLGLPILDTDRRGDLYIKIEVKIPKYGEYLAKKIEKHFTVPRDEVPLDAVDGLLYFYDDVEDIEMDD